MPIALVFTGHMTDLPDRKEPRFPPALEGAARSAIGAELDRLKAVAGAFASGARGGDILFHEECRKRGVATTIVLPFAPDAFEQASIAGAKGDWLPRFRRLWDETPAERRLVLNLPATDDAFAICNTHLLDLARRQGTPHLIALWDGKGGDGPGGTADMVTQAAAGGDRPRIIAPQDLMRP